MGGGSLAQRLPAAKVGGSPPSIMKNREQGGRAAVLVEPRLVGGTRAGQSPGSTGPGLASPACVGRRGDLSPERPAAPGGRRLAARPAGRTALRPGPARAGRLPSLGP